MRFIDPDRVEELLPADWFEKVQEAKDYVTKKVDETREKAEAEGKSPDEVYLQIRKARSSAILRKASVWRYFADNVKDLAHKKCWYCESNEDRSHMPVDHFRPKNRVTECPDHEGYWWLAFDWLNYRYCCTFCNSLITGDTTTGGKQNYFPILNPPNWARNDGDNLNIEQPVLLDPCDPSEPNLITFHENGFPREANQDEDSTEFKRANKSIELFHLHHDKAVKSRKRIAIKIRNLVKEIDSLRAERMEGANNKSSIKNRLKDLTKLIVEDASYRTAARLYLKGNINRKNQNWVQRVLDRN